MQHTLVHLLVAFLCCLPIYASAATQSIHIEWGYTPPIEPAVTGFRLYQEGVFVCKTVAPNAIAMDCNVTLTAPITKFTLTATFSDGTESPHSAPFSFSTTSDPTVLQAVINAAPLTGTVPLTVAFNAASSTGSISSFRWEFGDGSTATGNTASHAYTTAGTYMAQLTITDSKGQTSKASTTVTATKSTTSTTSPTAVIASSNALGSAPLTVNFNGSGSTAAKDAAIATYSWSFGDGSSATGASSAHSFVSVGTYNTTLTVSDSKGLTDSISTPVMVTATSAENEAPTAVISATPVRGASPLTVTFDGSGSSDSDGSVTSYTWNFGDGSSASGKTITHTYTGEATFIATLQVTDNQGAGGAVNTTITVQPNGQESVKSNNGMPWLLLLLPAK